MRGVDEMLDQSNWPPAWTRAHALECACTWLSGVDPYPTGRRQVLDVAEEFARWLAGDDERSET